ncbi:MAG: cytochrome [Gloeocapsa sp. DLM2.Bin57]|nr:MAG: cytochrome [Gloeocapsa sp. DLM2.Bin57]
MFNILPFLSYCLAIIIIAQGITPVPSTTNLETAKAVYIDNCSSCHIPIPAEVLPTETWQQILERPQNHYGTSVDNLVRISQVVIWQYMMTISRPLRPQERQPLYARESRYFRALHPRVELPEVVNHQSCIVCHPAAAQLDYQQLAPEWEDGP